MHRYRFPKSERIKSKKIFEKTLLFGTKLYSKSQRIKCSFILEKLDSESKKESLIKVAFVIGRKTGKAVWRNKVKRKLREIYRLNKHSIISLLGQYSKKLYLIISASKLNESFHRKVNYKELEGDVLELFETIKKEIANR